MKRFLRAEFIDFVSRSTNWNYSATRPTTLLPELHQGPSARLWPERTACGHTDLVPGADLRQQSAVFHELRRSWCHFDDRFLLGCGVNIIRTDYRTDGGTVGSVLGGRYLRIAICIWRDVNWDDFAGVSPGEILFSHVITQFVVMCGQTALVLLFMIIVFQVECRGSIFPVVVLTILQGLCGMCFGFVISAICELERNAIQLALGSFYPTLLLSGVIWPIEGMPIVLRYISTFLPLTLATTSLRSMMTRGWSILEMDVYLGFISTIVWIVLFLTISLVVLKIKRGWILGCHLMDYKQFLLIPIFYVIISKKIVLWIFYVCFWSIFFLFILNWRHYFYWNFWNIVLYVENLA